MCLQKRFTLDIKLMLSDADSVLTRVVTNFTPTYKCNVSWGEIFEFEG